MAIKRKIGYYPNNFDLDAFTAKYKLPANKVVSILDLFINKPVGQEDERWITLNAALLRKRVGNSYKAIMEALFDYEAIDINRSFMVDEYSMSYLLLDKYQKTDGIIKHSIEGATLNSALSALNNKTATNTYLADLMLPKIKRTVDLPEKIFNHKYRMLIHWFQTEKLSINKEKAYKILTEKNYKLSEPNRYLSYLASIEMLNDKNYHLKSDSNGRFYSSITNLPKALRGCLVYDGEELVGTDVSNTQPLLLSELCNPITLKNLKDSKSIEVVDKLFHSFLMHLDTNPSDLKEYKKLVQSGMLYESFVGVAAGLDRDAVKANMVKIINDKGYNDTREKKTLREALKLKYPTIAQLLDLLKSVDYHYASSTLMSMEAVNFVQHFPEIFSYNVAHKNIPIFTIHDCFLTTKSNIDYLEGEIKKFFHNNLMMNIPLKREQYDN